MEFLAILFVIGIVIWLNQEQPKPKPKDPWEEMGKSIGKALQTLSLCKSDGGGLKGDGGDKPSGGPFSTLCHIAAFFLLGVLLVIVVA